MDSSDDLTLLFTALSAACDVDVRRRMAAAGHHEVRTIHGYVFRHLLDGPIRITDLADLLGMTAQGASKVVADMERAGYASRSPDPHDSRVRLVSLTRRGHEAVRISRRARADVTGELLATLGPEGDKLITALRRLSDHTDALPDLLARRLRP
ncbi:hypothetical protein GCM10022243_18890 [Saccharothrix violaceirubra]|uniref:DNA-binding MarR family transcriptional regulator n=1 Tax=Saccharothrix violaceirubra TaxID=413306 RepID=A0A7W7T265_9PSEU|nr:MarR family transcriptional regulator [Saccharothrix violaceirubra]MBB4965204.1 DNA-binding MarR family transcriptional regulator [Saccharothrix violaceirubra]